MADALFPDADTLSALVSFVGQYAFWGGGIAFIGWAIGYVLYWVVDVLRY